MADGGAQIVARTVGAIAGIDAGKWNALANPPDRAFNPFVSHEFLSALEASHSVSEEAGWTPAHLILEDSAAIIAAAPIYAKTHSQGEYIFDHHWADAYIRAGGQYYPKFICAAPFTPVSGPRLLASDQGGRDALAAALRQLTLQAGASSIHVNFAEEAEINSLASSGFLARKGEQFHWFNKGYQSFDDFLSQLTSRKRKAIRKERREAQSSGVRIEQIGGKDITESHWDYFWAFYQDTGARKWGSPYLTRNFFSLTAASMPEKLLLFLAMRAGAPVAGALNFIGGDALYGRYWGCTEHIPFLHFELCYHQAIEYAIANGLSRVEAGAQGGHKLARGYEPVVTHSAHWISDPNFREAIRAYLQSERKQTEMDIMALQSFTPFKQNQGSS